MQTSLNKRNWWIILVVGGALAIGVTLIQQTLLPDYDFAAFIIAMIILGIAFYWVYTIDKQGFWWAQIPSLAMIVLLVTGIVGYFTPKDASGSSPFGVVALGLGAAVMGLVLKHSGAKFVMYAIAGITLVVGFLMLPLDLIWKIVLIIAEVVIIGYLMLQNSRQMGKK